MEPIEFNAILSSPRGLKISEDGGGMRATLDFDHSQLSAFLRLFVCAGKSLHFVATLEGTQ